MLCSRTRTIDHDHIAEPRDRAIKQVSHHPAFDGVKTSALEIISNLAAHSQVVRKDRYTRGHSSRIMQGRRGGFIGKIGCFVLRVYHRIASIFDGTWIEQNVYKSRIEQFSLKFRYNI